MFQDMCCSTIYHSEKLDNKWWKGRNPLDSYSMTELTVGHETISKGNVNDRVLNEKEYWNTY